MIRAKRGLNIFDRIILYLNYFAGFCLLISYLAPNTDPKTFWLIAFFGLAYPPLLLVNILLVLYWLFRFKKEIVISAFCIAIGWGTLQKNIGFHKTTDTDRSKADSSQIRVMAYNVHSFLAPKHPNASTRHQILQVIKDQQPDILTMEEFASTPRGKSAMCDSVKKVLNTTNYYFQLFSRYQGTNGLQTGLAIFSKYPIVNKNYIKLTNDLSDTKSIYVDVMIGKKMVRVYCVHLQSFLLNAEDHNTVDSISQNGKTSIKASRRIGGKLKIAFLHRSDQVKMMKEEMSRCSIPYIVAGDFNDTPSSYAVNQMAKGIKNAFREAGRGLGRTYNGDVPNYQIDYIMTSNQFNIINYTVIEKKLSDHYAIRSDITLP